MSDVQSLYEPELYSYSGGYIANEFRRSPARRGDILMKTHFLIIIRKSGRTATAQAALDASDREANRI